MACSEVVSGYACDLARLPYCGNVTLCEVDNVDIVAHAGAVRSGVVVAGNCEHVALAGSLIEHNRHKVVRNSVGILADKAALMRTNRIEIAQQYHCPGVVGGVHLPAEILNNELSASVGIDSGQRKILLNGNGRGDSVNGRGRTEHELGAAVLLHRLKNVERTAQVVGIVHQRLLYALGNALVAREMNHLLDVVFSEYLINCGNVEHVIFVEFEVLAGDLPDPIKGA